MTIQEIISSAKADLSTESAQLDTELLVAFVLDKSRTWVHAHGDYELSDDEFSRINELVGRRQKNEPIAYILGSKEFFGREFQVNEHVLVPRPESESFIELIKSLPVNQKFIDIGTGSGILAITSVIEHPSWSGVATDISPKALEVARRNAQKLGAKNLVFKKQNLLENDDEDYDVVIANLPYVPDSMKNRADISHEPGVALFAGTDGLDLYHELFRQLGTRSNQPKHIFTESLESQHRSLVELAKKAGYKPQSTQGLVQHFVLD